MSGIMVGVDGSGHSQRALEWAALDGPHPESVTVKAVHGFPVEEPQHARCPVLIVPPQDRA